MAYTHVSFERQSVPVRSRVHGSSRQVHGLASAAARVISMVWASAEPLRFGRAFAKTSRAAPISSRSASPAGWLTRCEAHRLGRRVAVHALVVRALVLNGVAGVAFGYLYWRHGLEAAMLGHMSAHVVMQIPGVMLLRTML